MDQVTLISSEGDIEQGVKLIYKAMVHKDKKKTSLRFLVPTQFMYAQFLHHLLFYLKARKAPKVEHVKVDIFIEEPTDGKEDRT